MIRIVLTGPESSGKTTLAAALAEAFDAPWTPEAARLFAEDSAGPLSAATVEPIARLSMEMEDTVIAARPKLIVRDTDLVSTVVYARHYYGAVPAWIETEARTRLADLYLLCHPDLPWTSDGIRDRPTQREELLADFRTTLATLGANIIEVSGVGDVRLARARAAVATLLSAAEVRRRDA